MNAPVKCPICQSETLTEFLFHARVPINQNMLMRDQASAIGVRRGDLALSTCSECGFIFNRAFDASGSMYGADYENNQGCSPSFEKYMNDLVHHMIVDRRVRDSHIVEVGCGNGLFLRKLVTYNGAGNVGIGFDPSYRGNASDLDGRLQFSNRYYDAGCADVPADVVVCRHVIEHVARPLDLLTTVKRALTRADEPRLFFETPCVEWILRNRVIWDFFYEHCSYFTAASLTTAFQIAGFQVENVTHVFGGQYLWLEATLTKASRTVTKQPNNIPQLALEFAKSEADDTLRWQEKIRKLSAKGKVALWGAGAKGATFANMIDPERCWIDCIVDLNPSKQGQFLPGTGHPIVSYRDLTERGITTAVLLNPNYHEENLALLQAIGTYIELVSSL